MPGRTSAALAALGIGSVLQAFAEPGTRVGAWLLLADVALTLAAVLLVADAVKRQDAADFGLRPPTATTALSVAQAALLVLVLIALYLWAKGKLAADEKLEPVLALSLASASYTAKIAAVVQLLNPEAARMAMMPPPHAVKRFAAQPGGRSDGHVGATRERSALPTASRTQQKQQGIQTDSTRIQFVLNVPSLRRKFNAVRNALREPTKIDMKKMAETFAEIAKVAFGQRSQQQDPHELITQLVVADSRAFLPVAIRETTTIICKGENQERSPPSPQLSYVVSAKTSASNNSLQQVWEALKEQKEEVVLDACASKKVNKTTTYDPTGHMMILQTWSFKWESGRQSGSAPQLTNPWETFENTSWYVRATWSPVAWIVHTGSQTGQFGHYSIYIRQINDDDSLSDSVWHVNDQIITDMSLSDANLSDSSKHLAYVLLCSDLKKYKATLQRRYGETKPPSGLQGIDNLCYFNATMQMLMLTDIIDQPINPWDDIPETIARVHYCPMRLSTTDKVVNQDRFVGKKMNGAYLFAVFDGHGGNHKTDIHGTSPVAETIAMTIANADEAILDYNREGWENYFKTLNNAKNLKRSSEFGSVCIIGIIKKDGSITIVNVGDCFARLSKADEQPAKLPAVNIEHDVNQEDEKARVQDILDEQGRVVSAVTETTNVSSMEPTRVFGDLSTQDFNGKSVKILNKLIEPRPDMYVFRRATSTYEATFAYETVKQDTTPVFDPSTKYLLLCSDGFKKELREMKAEEMWKLLASSNMEKHEVFDNTLFPCPSGTDSVAYARRGPADDQTLIMVDLDAVKDQLNK